MNDINFNYQDLKIQESIKITNLSLSIGSKNLLNETDLVINNGTNYGIIAPNGCGKTTLLVAISSQLKIDNKIIYMVKQEENSSSYTVIEEVLKSHKNYQKYITQENNLTKLLEDCNEDKIDEINIQLEELYNWGSSLGLKSIKSKAAKILVGLGFDINSSKGNMQEMKVESFSGGWRMRVSLAKALLNEPDLLILDEPTNHLDLNAVIWLGDYLQNWNKNKNSKKKSLLLVSHDEDFLDEVSNKILRIDNLKIKCYNGNYRKMLNIIDQEKRKEEKEWNKKKKHIKSKKEKKKQRPKKEYNVSFEFDDEGMLDGKVGLEDVSFKYENCDFLFRDINFGISCGDKIVIVGKNGVGKSTFLKLLTGELKPNSGERIINKNTWIGKYNQHFEGTLPMEKTPVEYLKNLFEEDSDQIIRRHLSQFNLDSKAHTIPIKKCSGGQKSRIAFSTLCMSNILILDEPTNHLDIETISGLVKALKSYKGAIVLVSHDAKLIRELDCRIFICQNKTIEEYDGDFDDYRLDILEEIENINKETK